MTSARRQVQVSGPRLLVMLAAGAACSLGAAPAHTSAAASFDWAPAGDPAVARGRQVAARFDQESLWEISVEVNDAFSVENRHAVAVAEEELRRVPGVRRVFGPAGLLEISVDARVDARARITARTILDRPGGEGEDEAARQRIVRRADALGWFLPDDGGRVRFLIDADQPASLGHALEQAIASSGLQLLHAGGAHLDGAALWPRPADRLALALAPSLGAASVLLLLVAGWRIGRRAGVLTRARRGPVIVAAMIGAAAPFALVAVPAVRMLGLRAALAAGLGATLAVAFDRAPRPAPSPSARAARPPAVLVLAATLLVVAAMSLAGRVRVGTQQWRATPFLLISVRGDLDQPVVLREVRRLTDHLRAQPGVAAAWSVTDLFTGVSFPDDEPSRIPDDATLVRQILDQARDDPALALELAPDDREGLVVIRLDDEEGVSRLDVLDGLTRYLTTELRTTLLRVDLGRADLPAVTRSLGKGLLAADASWRIARICERSGRPLSDGESATVERLARQTALVPALDLGKLRGELGAPLRIALRGTGATVAQRARLAEDLAVLGGDATAEDVRRALAARLGAGAGDKTLARIAGALHGQLAAARVRNSARVNFREMLYGADLPVEGPLADEVRGATRDAMGPIAGIPIAGTSISAGPAASTAAGVYRLDATPIGGAANDRALSRLLPRAMRWGVLLAAGALALLLLASGRGRGLLWLPVGLGPVSVAIIVAALAGDPVGVPFASFVGATLAGGAAWAVSMAARRRA